MMKRYVWILSIVFCITGCGKNPADKVSFALPNIDTGQEFQKAAEEETTEVETTQEETTAERIINMPYKEEIELLIEKYNEAEHLFSGDLSQRDYYNVIYTGEHKGSYRLKYLEYNTIAGMDAYWRQYFSQAFYDERFGANRERDFFEYDGDLCMQCVSGFVDKIIFESVSDWIETDNGMEACFNIRKNRCSEFINDTEHFDRVRITFVWENDTLKIGKILDLERPDYIQSTIQPNERTTHHETDIEKDRMLAFLNNELAVRTYPNAEPGVSLYYGDITDEAAEEKTKEPRYQIMDVTGNGENEYIFYLDNKAVCMVYDEMFEEFYCLWSSDTKDAFFLGDGQILTFIPGGTNRYTYLILDQTGWIAKQKEFCITLTEEPVIEIDGEPVTEDTWKKEFDWIMDLYHTRSQMLTFEDLLK